MFLLQDPDRSTVARQDFFEPDLSVNPLSAAVRGVMSGMSLAPTVAQFVMGDDEPLVDELPSLLTMGRRGLRGTIAPLVDNAAEAATLYRARQEDAMMQSGLASNLSYGISYYLSGFVGGGLNPASYGLGLGKARMETEIRAGVDEDTAFTIGAIEGVTAGVGATIPFLGKTVAQRFGFGVAANVVPGIAQRKAEQATFGEVYAERAPDVFDPVALAVDAVMGGAFGYLAGLGAKPETIPVDAINDALDANINVRSGDTAPGFPNPKAFGIHMRMVKETIDAQNEGRAPDYTPLLDAEFADSPEMIRNFEESLADVTAGRMTEDRPIYDDILPQIEATGVYSAPEARANAKLASMAYTAMAKRMGMNPRDLMDQMPLKVITDAIEGLSQPKRNMEDVADLNALADFYAQDDNFQFDNYEQREAIFDRLVARKMADEGFEGMDLPTSFGSIVITPSAKEAGSWQVTAFDKNMRPLSDEGIQTKEKALRTFFEQARPVADQPLRQSMPEPKDLFVGHNLSAGNLRAVLELGGLAAPSLGISRTTTRGFDGYGEITLLAPKEIIEQPSARTFNADVYSPRQPRPTYKVDKKGISDFAEKVNSMPLAKDRRARQIDEDEIARYGAEGLARVDGVQMLYLSEIGQLPKPKAKKVDPFIKQAAKLPEASRSYNLVGDPKFQQIAVKHYENQLKLIAEASPERAERFRDVFFEEDGTLNRKSLSRLADEVGDYAASNGLDFNAYREAISAKLRTKAQSDAFSKWLEQQSKRFIVGKQLSITPSRKVPYTLESVTDQMTKTIRGGEGFNYGAGNIRAMNAAEITSIIEVQNRREEIVSGEDFKRIKDESSKRLNDTLEALAPYYKYDADSWGYMNDATSALAEGPKGWRSAFRVTKDSEKIIRDYIGYVKNLPTEYFEIKMQRSMQLNEFSTAIVPSDLPKDLVDELSSRGLKIQKYNPKLENARSNAIAKQRDMLFQEARGTYSPDTNTIGLTRAADSSTFVHELGHHLFEMLGKLASDPNAPTQIRADFETLVKHGGMKVDDWYASDINTRRAAHEQIADDFETYLMTGEAPSLELRNLFGMIRDWMLGVYKTIRGEVQPEVRAVFDRMLATDEQIAMKAQVVDYLAVQRQTEAKAKSSLDDNLMAAERAIDPDVEVVIDGTRIKASELLKAEEPQEATAMQKLKECLLNV